MREMDDHFVIDKLAGASQDFYVAFRVSREWREAESAPYYCRRICGLSSPDRMNLEIYI